MDLGDGYTYTLEEVGRIFKVTRERVRQIEAKAVRKLQHPGEKPAVGRVSRKYRMIESHDPRLPQASGGFFVGSSVDRIDSDRAGNLPLIPNKQPREDRD